MLKWFLPQEDRFFVLIRQQVENVLETCRAFQEMLKKYEKIEQKADTIHQLEHQGDNLCQAVSHFLDTTFVTPLDREDIHALAKSLEWVNNNIDGAARRMVLFKIKKPTSEMMRLSDILERCVKELCEAIPKLSNPSLGEEIRVHLREVNNLEREGDRVHHGALARLFQEETDAVKIIKLKEVTEYLENAVDQCDRVGHVIERIVVKHG